jgi:hypothetical protein
MGNKQNNQHLSTDITNPSSYPHSSLKNTQNNTNNQNNHIIRRNSNINIETLYYNNGDYYIGETLQKSRNGYGTYYYKNGNKYEGFWLDNLKHGKGTFFYNTGEMYEGYFVNNKKDGYGEYFYKNGDRYQGEFKENKRNGKGTLYLNNGCKYIGKFKNDEKDGKGEFTNKKGEIQYEQWENGKLLMKNNKEIIEEKTNMNEIDYFNEVNTIKYEKYINKKIKEINDTKSNLVKISARDLSKEMTKENIQKIMNIIKENPDVSNWNNNDVINFFEKINFNKKYIEQLKNINGKELLNIDQNYIQNILGINDKFEINYLLRNIELLKYLKLDKREKIYEDNEEQPNSQEEIDNNNKNNNIIDEKLNSMPEIKKNANNNQNKEKKNELNPFEKENLIQELSRKSKYFYSSLNLNGLNYFINFDEIKKDKIKIGQGGFGEIYLGNWQGKKVAIKKLTLINLRVGDNNLSKFINEINIISSLRHPNIVLYMGASVDKENYYMISEYLPNGTLFDLLHNNNNTNSNNNKKNNNNNYGENINNNSLISTNNNSINNFDNYSKNSFFLNDSMKIKIALQIAFVIKYLHSRKIVHCDLKSPNILIDKNYNIKLGDFGLSRFIGKNSENIKGKIGTPHWMAPEILLGGKYEYHSDIFSYGMILWEILTGDIPYNNIDPKKIENLITNEKNIVKVPDYGNLILRKLCKKCINYDPQKRPSINEILRELKNIYDKDDDDKDFLEYIS